MNDKVFNYIKYCRHMQFNNKNDTINDTQILNLLIEYKFYSFADELVFTV